VVVNLLMPGVIHSSAFLIGGAHMLRTQRSRISIFYLSIATFLASLVLLPLVAFSAQAQTLTVLHAFSGPDGAFPFAGLTPDGQGNFYGTTSAGGNNGCQSQVGCGTVFKLSPSGDNWVFTTLYKFHGGGDGWEPFANLVIGPGNALYGTTNYGGDPGGHFGYGTVFELTPPAEECASCPWTHTVLYRFTGGSDGIQPAQTGNLSFDSAGNIYGTAQAGGNFNETCFDNSCGVVYELSLSADGWTESVLYSFTGGQDGDAPNGGVVFDHGNLLGTTTQGALGYGAVFELTPSASGWQEHTLHQFNNVSDGAFPTGNLLLDSSGTFYGTTGALFNAGGTDYELTPSGDGWNFTVLCIQPFPNDPQGTLTLSNGDLYGVTPDGGSNGFGSVYGLTPGSDGWSLTIIYNFLTQNDPPNAPNSPNNNVVVDANGNMYSTSNGGGTYQDGVIFEITP
jgi:uncharacterized repeat protein (TIGR03803 family)